MEAEINEQYKIDKKAELEILKLELTGKLSRTKKNKRLVIGVSFLIFVSSLTYYSFVGRPIYVIGGLLMAALYLLPIFVFSSSEIDSQILQLQNEIDLLSIEDTSIEIRAEKLFKYHQIELKKYYDQTLKHTSWIFVIGLLCILGGFLTVGVTLYLIYSKNTIDLNEKILLGSVGTISTLMANFIGAIYLKMYSETVKSLTEFHNRLVLTHHLHFGNYMISKIDDKELREKTLSELTLKIADNRHSN